LRAVWKQLHRHAAIAFLAVLAAPMLQAQTDDRVPKQVDLIVESYGLVASNVRASSFHELKFNAQERVAQSRVGDAVIVVVTNQRIIAYGVGSGWRAVPRIASERIERVEAEDYAGLVVSNRRFLNFNGESGVWGERDRRAGQ
jgi:hypothetical protein